MANKYITEKIRAIWVFCSVLFVTSLVSIQAIAHTGNCYLPINTKTEASSPINITAITCNAIAAAPIGIVTPTTFCQQGGTLAGSSAIDPTTLSSNHERLYLLVDNATNIIWDNKATIAQLTAPANTSNVDIIYSIYSLVYNTESFNTVNITNGITTIALGDANVITDYDGIDAVQATPTADACMALSVAAATTVTVGKKLDFEYDNFLICGNTAANIDLFSPIAGLQVTWAASSAGGVTGFTNQATPVALNGLGSFDITDVLSNTSASPATVVYVVTPQLNTCFGAPVTITQTVLPNLSVAITSTTCNGANYNASFAITGGSGSFAAYSNVGIINYTPDFATGTITNIPLGTLYLTIDDAGSCLASASTTVTIPDAPLISITNSVCTTGCAPSGGSFNITTACTTGTLTYYTDAMGAGATTTASIYNQTGPAQTIYYACVEVNGCGSAIQTSATTIPGTCTPVTAGLSNNGTLTCALTSVTLTGTGGVTYVYSDGSATVTAPGTYTVTVTGSNGCTATATTEVTQNITAPITGLSNNGPLTCVLTSVTLTGTGGGTYVYSGGSATVTAPGTYTVTVTGTNGCTATATTNVTGNSIPPIAFASNTGLVCEGGTIVMGVNPNLPVGVTATYLWSGPAGTATTQNPSINNMTSVKAGLYTVTITYSNGCTATATTTLGMNPKPVISSVVSTCVAGSSRITVTATGTGLIYNIGTGAQSSNVFNSVANGTYTVIVTNSTGCTAKSTISVFCATCPMAVASNNGPACAGGNLMLIINPALPNGVTATYFWVGPGGTATIQNPTITSFSPGKTGVYTVTVTYSNGCTATASTTATIAPSIAGTILGSSTFCIGGSAVLTASGGINYVWSTSATTPAITVTAAGTYVVTITNGPTCKRVSKTVTTVSCKDEEELSQMQSLSVTPNPFAGRATIEFMTNSNGNTSINVYSIDGRQLATLYHANTQAGEIYQVTLDGANLPNGMYFVEMTNANGKKMLVKAVLSN